MLTGRCACKALGYAVEDEFTVAYNCHCSNCRALTGSAFLPWGEIAPDKLRLTGAPEARFVDGDAEATHASGADVVGPSCIGPCTTTAAPGYGCPSAP